MAQKFGYIRNARSTRARSTPPPAADLILRAPTDFFELDEALAEMREAAVDVVVIDGGDGTIREVLSRAQDVWGGGPPDFAIIRNGNTNLVARSAGSLPPDDPLAPLRQGGLRRTQIRMMKAVRPDKPPLRGFIMGAGAYETMTRVAQEEIASRHGLQVAAAIAKLAFSRSMRAGEAFSVAHDDEAPKSEARMLIGMSSLPGNLIFGLSPFWNTGAGAIRWLDVAANPPALLLAIPFVAFGKPMRWMRRAYRSGSSDVVDLTLRGDFVMDGDRFSPGSGGKVRVTAAEAATFLAP